MTRGLWYGAGAYAIWGLFPLYWKLIEFVPSDQIIAHRILWSFLLLVLVLAPRHGLGRLWKSGASVVTARMFGLYSAAAVLIAVNWLIYVWAVTHGYIVETSLGYFITPLVNVLLGVVVFGERLRTFQRVSVALAGVGVAYLAMVYGDVPWIALGLAASFGTYGLIKKQAPLGAALGLTFETGLLVLPALAYLAAAEWRGTGVFLQLGAADKSLLAAAGPVTTLPLLLFAAAVRRVPLSAIGILQFIAPTLQFLLGVLVYGEPFSRQQFVGFALVWSAVIVFGLEGLLARTQRRPPAVLDEGEF